MDYKKLWQELNERGDNENHGPWDFIWGSPDLNDIRKACETAMNPSYVDIWLNHRSSPYWGMKSPMDSINNGNHDDVYFAIYQLWNMK